ncbi:hypothetical protein LPJ81_002403 [Coemansia sp. IMI 209127]|nr:hypothetical protein LPJ81_002403 [Coemansia sp. IMI 209127]
MRLGAGSVFGFLQKSTIRQQRALCRARTHVLAVRESLGADSRKHIVNIAGSKYTHRPSTIGAHSRSQFSTDRDGDSGKEGKEDKDHIEDKEGSETGEPHDGTNKEDTEHMESAIPDPLSGRLAGSPSPQRIEMFRGIRAQDPERVWNAFNEVANTSEWDRLTEEEITQVIHVFNNQFSYERSKQALDRVKSIFYICIQRHYVFQKAWGYNEMLRLNISEGRRELAYKLKAGMESGKYGADVTVDVHTYAAFFNDPYISSRKELAQLIDLYDEMNSRNIKPDTRIQKALLLYARQFDEKRLLTTLLDSTSTEDIPYSSSTLAARSISARTKAYAYMHKPKLAQEELNKLLSYQIPKDTRHIPPIHVSGSDLGLVQIPLSHSRTRDAFFVYLRSAYEALIRTHLTRRNPHFARDTMDDMRRTSYLPPTLVIYELFIRFHAKRKDIRQLRELYEMMQQDGLRVSEHFYTKFITACMFTPKERLFEHLKGKAVKISQNAGERKGIDQDPAPANEPGVDGAEIRTGLDVKKAEVSEIALDKRAEEELDRLIFHPNECIQFFEDMLADYGVSASAIHDKGYIPNINITNSVMRAYLRRERYALALREFIRYCYHQKQLYPMSRPLDVERSPRTISVVFGMALEAARLHKDTKSEQRIYTTIREWGVRIPETRMRARNFKY